MVCASSLTFISRKNRHCYGSEVLSSHKGPQKDNVATPLKDSVCSRMVPFIGGSPTFFAPDNICAHAHQFHTIPCAHACARARLSSRKRLATITDLRQRRAVSPATCMLFSPLLLGVCLIPVEWPLRIHGVQFLANTLNAKKVSV